MYGEISHAFVHANDEYVWYVLAWKTNEGVGAVGETNKIAICERIFLRFVTLISPRPCTRTNDPRPSHTRLTTLHTKFPRARHDFMLGMAADTHG